MKDPTAGLTSCTQKSSHALGLFWLGQTISSLGDAFTGFALPLLVYKLTGSALNLAISSAVSFIPYLLFGLPIGALADRANRRRLMIVVDIALALLIGSIPLLASAGFFALWYIYLVQLVAATLAIGFNAAQAAALPSLVEREALVAANGQMIAGLSAASIAGPLLAGLLSAFVALPTLLLVDAISFLVAALALGLIRRSFNAEMQPRRARLRQEIAEGLHFVWHSPLIRTITLLLLCLNVVGPTAHVQLVLFAKQLLHASDAQVGLLWSAAGAGVLVGSLAAGWLRRRGPSGSLVLAAVVAKALLMLAFATTRDYWPALLLWSLLSGVGVLADINIMALRQATAPNHMLGRVTTISRTIGFAAIPLSTLLGGLLIDRLGHVAPVYSTIGALTLLIGLGFLRSPLAHTGTTA